MSSNNPADPRVVRAEQPYSEQAFALYWRILLVPTALAFLLFIILNRIGIIPADWQTILAETCFFLFLAAYARIHGVSNRASIMVMNGMSAVLLGLAVALTKLVTVGAFYLVFNLLVEPARTLVIALAVGFVVSLAAFRIALPHFARQQ